MDQLRLKSAVCCSRNQDFLFFTSFVNFKFLKFSTVAVVDNGMLQIHKVQKEVKKKSNRIKVATGLLMIYVKTQRNITVKRLEERLFY